MIKDRACANTPTMSRRTLLAALPATGIALAPYTLAFASQPTPILILFREWEAARANANGVSDDDCEKFVARMTSLEDQMSEIPSRTVADLAAKIAAYSSWGDFALPNEPHPIWNDMRQHLSAA